jgi:hypothetical protein
MITSELVNLFKNYIAGFKSYDLAAVKNCYHLPCSLHTPDKIAYLPTSKDFKEEFLNVFVVLKQGCTKDIRVTKATFSECVNGSVDICIDWQFIDDKNEVFADFCAFYHVIKFENKYKIISVISHDLSNSVELSSVLELVHLNEKS